MGATSDEIKNAVVVYALRIRKPGASGKVNSADVKVRAAHVNESEAHDPEADSLKISKVLIRHEKYKEITSLDGSLRSFLRSQALPTRLAGGRYLVPVALVERIDAHVAKRAEERAQLVRELVEVYPAIVEDARARLRDMFDESDFPKVEDFSAAFDVEVSIAAIADPGTALGQFSAALYRRECEKAEKARREMVAEIQDGMRFAMRELVAGLADQLKPSGDGTRKRIMAQGFDKLRTFLDEFQARNVAQDGELEKLVKQARDMVAGVKVETLRASPRLRDSVEKNLAGLRETLDNLTTSDGTTLRASFLEVGQVDDRGPLPAPEASERAARLDLGATSAPIPIVAADPKATRPYLDLSDGASKVAVKKAERSRRAAKLELD